MTICGTGFSVIFNHFNCVIKLVVITVADCITEAITDCNYLFMPSHQINCMSFIWCFTETHTETLCITVNWQEGATQIVGKFGLAGVDVQPWTWYIIKPILPIRKRKLLNRPSETRYGGNSLCTSNLRKEGKYTWPWLLSYFLCVADGV